MNTATKILINIAYAFLTVGAAVFSDPGAVNLVYFLAWVHIVLGSFALIAFGMKDWKSKHHQRSRYRQLIPREVDGMYDIALMCLFAWAGLWVPVSGMLITLFVTQRLYTLDDEADKAAA